MVATPPHDRIFPQGYGLPGPAPRMLGEAAVGGGRIEGVTTTSSGLGDSGSAFPGALLVATPQIEEPTFRRTVILLLEHLADGSLGVVLNDPSSVPAAEVMPMWSGVLHTDICVGGPVQTDAAVAVARLDPAATASPPEGLRPIAGPWAVVDLDSEPMATSGAIVDAQLFLGYAGWGAGQLAGELRTGSWWVVDSAPGDLALGRRRGREGAWWSVLRRQRNDLRLASTFPEDPSLN